MVPRQGSLMDAEMFERMERLPCTAIGMWLFPAEAFGEPTNVRKAVFDMSAVNPGLFCLMCNNGDRPGIGSVRAVDGG